MAKFPLLRTRFSNDIVAEFLPTQTPTDKVAIIASGAPGYPGGKHELMELLSRKGYFPILPRYRGTWESDGEFLALPPSDDVIAIIDALPSGFRDIWSSADYRIHNPQVYLIGGSFGGPASILASRDVRVRKAVAISPVIDWREQEHTIEPLPLMSEFVPKAFGQSYRARSDVWQKLAEGNFYSPIDEKESIDGSKLLLMHAKDDQVVPFAPAQQFAKDVGARFVAFERGGHMGAGSAVNHSHFKHIQKFFTEK